MNLLNILSFCLLFIPTIWELINDRKGDYNKDIDVFYRLISAGVISFAVHLFAKVNIYAAFNLAMAIHFLFFDYAIAAILIHNKTLEPPRGVKYHWWTYQAKKGVIDNISFWKNLNPYVKLLIRVTYFVISIILYFTV